MIISLLPHEILALIASYAFTTHDKYQYECLKVCRSWLTSFRPSLYHNVHITSRRQFDQFIHIIQQNEELGLYVKYLSFDDHVGITRDEFEQMPYYLPLLQSLDFNPRLWKYQRGYKKMDPSNKQWKRMTKLPPLDRIGLALPLLEYYGDSLQDLTLSGNIVNQLHMNEKKLLPLFQWTPQLKHLRMYGRDKLHATTISGYQRTEFTLTDILDLHSSLPLLENLELLDVVLSMWPSELQSYYPMTRHFPQMQRFLVQGKLVHYQWIANVAELYPNLTDLEFNVSWDEAYKQTMTRMEKEAVKSSLIYIAKHCHFLKKVRLVSVGSVVKAGDQTFYETLSKVLESVDGIMTSSLTNLKSLSAAILQCCDADTTKTLRLQLWRDLRSIENIMIPIAKCQQLQELELHCGKFSYSWNYGCDIDTILKYCPQLKVLNLTMTRMTVSNKITDKPYSKVEFMQLNQVHFTTESMNALSLWCPNLKHLKLLHCVKDKDALEQKISIQLPYQSLETLLIDHVCLRPSEYIEKSSIDSAILALDFTDRDEKKTIRLGGAKNNMTRWYHLYSKKKKNRGGHVRQLKKLDYIQSNQVEEYKMKEKDWDILEETSIRGTYRERKYWDSDIPYGYVQITCKSINNLMFNKVKL